MKRKMFFALLLVLLLSMFLCSAVYADTGPSGDLDMISDIINGVSFYAVAAIGIAGFLAFLVSFFVQITKKAPLIRGWPTDVHVIVFSFILCEFILFGYAAWRDLDVQWYYIGLAFFMSLVVSGVAMFGWDKTYSLYKRFTKFKE